jgi:hypothetical protein
MNHLKSKLIYVGVDYHSGKCREIIAQHEISHNNEKTTLEQKLQLKFDGKNWSAHMEFDGMPECKSPTDAAWKLAEWMERMAETIKESTYADFNLMDVAGD